MSLDELGGATGNISSGSVDCAYVTFVLDDECRIKFCNDEFWQKLGYPSKAEFKEMTANQMRNIVDAEDWDAVHDELIWQIFDNNTMHIDCRVDCMDGSQLPVSIYGCGISEDDGQILVSSVLMDARSMTENMDFLQEYEPSVGLCTQKGFCRRAEEILAGQPDTAFEIMQMDIQRFNVASEILGEGSGESLLQYVADFFRSTDLPLSAYGHIFGDKFLLMYPASPENREDFVLILQDMAMGFQADYQIEVYFGVYPILERDRAISLQTICKRVGLAVGEAEQAGERCVEYREDIGQKIIKEQRVANEMWAALAKKEFICYLQPRYHVEAKKIIGAEALVRWMHPQQGCLMPKDFLSIFENNGFIAALDEYMWGTVCSFLRKWMDEGKNPLPISVNISRFDIHEIDVVRIFQGLLDEYSIPPHLLEMEISEQTYDGDRQHLVDVVKRLRDMGFHIMMDNFGTGCASLSLLKDIAVDELKVNVRRLLLDDRQGRGQKILEAVVGLAHSLGMPVTAEGVENAQQLSLLQQAGCERAQGFFYSQPVPVEEYEQLAFARA